MYANNAIRCFFPPPSVLLVVVPIKWRARLRDAVERSGKKHSAVAEEAGVDPATLSRILNGRMQPAFDTVVKIAHAVGASVGRLLDERGFSLSRDEQRQLRSVVHFLGDALADRLAHRRDRQEPNAASVDADIPHPYVARGARLTYESAGDSMIGVGIADRDLLFVKPTRSMREATGRIVVCRVDGAEYVRVLDVREGRIRLLSRNPRYMPIEVAEESNQFELIGIVIGRTGAC